MPLPAWVWRRCPWARRERVADDGTDWGSYYDAAPELLVGDIDAGMRYLIACGMVSGTPDRDALA